MNDESRELRYRLGALCERYNAMISDKDALDFRLGSRAPYDVTTGTVDAERAYEEESGSVSGDLRHLILDIIDTGQRIRTIEHF
jgi:hypothetical protein